MKRLSYKWFYGLIMSACLLSQTTTRTAQCALKLVNMDGKTAVAASAAALWAAYYINKEYGSKPAGLVLVGCFGALLTDASRILFNQYEQRNLESRWTAFDKVVFYADYEQPRKKFTLTDWLEKDSYKILGGVIERLYPGQKSQDQVINFARDLDNALSERQLSVLQVEKGTGLLNWIQRNSNERNKDLSSARRFMTKSENLDLSVIARTLVANGAEKFNYYDSTLREGTAFIQTGLGTIMHTSSYGLQGPSFNSRVRLQWKLFKEYVILYHIRYKLLPDLSHELKQTQRPFIQQSQLVVVKKDTQSTTQAHRRTLSQ